MYMDTKGGKAGWGGTGVGIDIHGVLYIKQKAKWGLNMALRDSTQRLSGDKKEYIYT